MNIRSVGVTSKSWYSAVTLQVSGRAECGVKPWYFAASTACVRYRAGRIHQRRGGLRQRALRESAAGRGEGAQLRDAREKRSAGRRGIGIDGTTRIAHGFAPCGVCLWSY